MKTSVRILFVFTLMLALVFSTGVAYAKKAIKPVYTGFLGDYPTFKPGPKHGADHVYIKEGADFKAYDKVMMDEVVFYFKKDAEYKGIHPDEINQLSNAFHEAMVEALGSAYPLVEEPGPGVLRIRVALTEVVPSKPALNTITAIVPIGLAISIIKKGATGTHTYVGGASMEAELLDALTNERLGAAIDTKSAEKYKIKKGMSKWGHAKDAFEFWAKRLRFFLDEAHGK